MSDLDFFALYSARASQLPQEYIKHREHLFIVVYVIEYRGGQKIVGEFDPTVDMQERTRRQGKRLQGD